MRFALVGRVATALLFPGQGAQFVGMDAGLDPDVFAEADDALGFALSAAIRSGPEARLAQTEITQPAILTVSVAMTRRLRAARPDLEIVAAAGHSLGEYGALVAAGALAFRDAVRLVRLRGRAMQDAVPLGVGTMGAVMGLPIEAVEELCARERAEVVSIAGVNCQGQTVVAGHVGAVTRLLDAANDAGGAGKLLSVSAPFHCSLLGPAAEALRLALADVRIAPCAFPVVHNIDAGVAADAEAIRARLVEQVVRPVQWVGCVRALIAMGATEFIELGPGKTLAGLGKRIDRTVPVRALADVLA